MKESASEERILAIVGGDKQLIEKLRETAEK